MGMTSGTSRKRHLAKTLTWRVIASATTFGIAFVFFAEDPHALEKAGGVAAVEMILKTFLYYFHERAWFRFSSMGRLNSTKDA
jgi:uncharacterized membrane protein